MSQDRACRSIRVKLGEISGHKTPRRLRHASSSIARWVRFRTFDDMSSPVLFCPVLDSRIARWVRFANFDDRSTEVNLRQLAPLASTCVKRSAIACGFAVRRASARAPRTAKPQMTLNTGPTLVMPPPLTGELRDLAQIAQPRGRKSRNLPENPAQKFLSDLQFLFYDTCATARKSRNPRLTIDPGNRRVVGPVFPRRVLWTRIGLPNTIRVHRTRREGW